MAILAKYHSNGDENDEMVQDEFYNICQSIQAESASKSKGWAAFWESSSNMHRLAICVMLGFMQEWSGNGMADFYLCYYGFFFANYIFQVWSPII